MVTGGEPLTGDSDQLSLHQGEVLYGLAKTYPTLYLTIVEAVQNAIDAEATTVLVGIDPVGREVVVLDNGFGVTQDKFREALKSVGKSVKRPGSLGRFGRGLVAPLDKCRRYIFASHPLGQGYANVWTFVGEEILRQHEDIQVPVEHEPRLPVVPRRFAKMARGLDATWRTVVHLQEVTTDKVVGASNITELEGRIRTKLGVGMRRAGTTVHVFVNDGHGHVDNRTINPHIFLGQPLPVVEYRDSDCGKVVIELYRAPKTSGGKRDGKVFVMELDDNYPVTWREYTTQAMGAGWLSDVKDAMDVLASGYFEGVIRVEGIELAPERNKFVLDDALLATYTVVHQWYSEHGRDYYEDETEAHRDERYRELGEKSLARLVDMLEQQEFAIIGQQLLGLLPDEPDAQRALDRREQRERPTEGGTKAKRKRKPPIAKAPERPPASPQDEPHAFTLKFAYEMLEGSPYLWEFDAESGVLTFNIRHPVWVMLDETKGRRTTKNDRQIMHLQEWLALQLLLLLARHGNLDFDFDNERDPIDQEAPIYARMFIQAAKQR